MEIKKLSVVVSVLIGLAIGYSFGKRITLVAEEDIQVTELPTDGRTVGVISKGESVNVSECKDLKHYIVPKVQLSNGVSGYVLKGNFHLIRHSAWDLTDGMLSYSCL